MRFQKQKTEKRESPRARRSDAMFWQYGNGDPLRMGWLLERSDSGLAFAWRGEDPPVTDQLIEIYTDSDQLDETPESCRVKRIINAHDNLHVIAAEIKKTRPFPPAAAQAVATVEVTWSNARPAGVLRGVVPASTVSPAF